jgi:hypothetical protein
MTKTFDLAYIDAMIVGVVEHGGDLAAEVAAEADKAGIQIDFNDCAIVSNVIEVENTDDFESRDVAWRNGVFGESGGYVFASAMTTNG